MIERKNLPAKLTPQEVVVHIEQRGLVARGMAAVMSSKDPSLAEDLDAFYRQARDAYNHITELGDKSGFGIVWTRSDLDDLKDALDAFKQLADKQYGKAYFPLSLLHNGGRSFPVHREHAQHYARLAFDWCIANQNKNDPEIWNDLGRLYWLGEVVRTDYEQALYWYQKAAEGELEQAQYNLGAMYYNGQGVIQDYQQATVF